PAEAAGRWIAVDLQRLRGRDKLVALDLHHTALITEADLEPVASLPLRSLELHGPLRISGKLLAGFKDLESLTLLSNPDFADADLAAIGRLSKLTFLAVNSPKITAAGMSELKKIPLRALILGENVPISANYTRALQTMPLEEFRSDAGITDDAFLEFAIVLTMKRLHVRRTTLTDAALKAVAGMGDLE